MQFEAIIFDLGGVLFDLDYERTANAFRLLGIKDFDAIYSQAAQEGLFDTFEKGIISSEEFRTKLRKWLPAKVTDMEIDSAWNAMLLGMPSERIRLLEKIKKHYRIFLLSNTNEIHLETVLWMMRSDHGFPDLSHLVEKQYFSNKLGKRKPEIKIFEQVIDENGLNASCCLFIDDSIQHVEGARRAGLNAFHLVNKSDLEKLFFPSEVQE